MKQLANRLGTEYSLYLRQHADNPVHWQPWDPAALDAAREQDRPILLSIGYSACHWCHVMAHESFEDAATAGVMNRLFVNIKVDREERPDLDRVYQLAHQLLTGRGGGWPLTVFLDPQDHVPFFAGTYFPRERRHGMPAFRELLEAIDRWFRENRGELQGQNARLREALESIQGAGQGAAAPGQAEMNAAPALFARGAGQALDRFDPVHGGFGGAPRFPQAPLLEALAALSGDGQDLGRDPSQELDRAVRFTLERMALSGLRDHLDGGFFRYCVDAAWTIPHFEKMLYDNAMLLPLYAEGARRWYSALLQSAAAGIADWLETAMRQPSGGYAASIDADAGGEEGGFHVWRPAEVEAVLGASIPAPGPQLFRRAYGLDGPANFEGRAWHLQRTASSDKLADELAGASGLSADAVESLLQTARTALRRKRETRVHPTLDDKRLTSWNALLAGGLVRAGRALGREDWLDRAEEIFSFIRRELWSGRSLLAVYNGGAARFAAYLDDYAWLLRALLDGLQQRWNRAWLDFAIELAEALLQRFEDPERGGFFFSDAEVEVPIARSMIFQDDATPSGNGIAALALNRLARLLGEPRFGDAAERCLRRAMPRIVESPLAHAAMLLALRDAVAPPPQLVIAGTDPGEQAAWKRWVESRHAVDCYLLGAAATAPEGARLPGILGEFRSQRPATAWLCLGMRCLPPAHSRDQLESLLLDTMKT
ncbi:MAG: thioredoxin domain-containing protein [Lysobacterales bacterium]|nr:MAG: thioredoxin domain-containing protein [Xanthomonadales bacterium]